MSRSAAATAAGRQHAPHRPRRVSGPAGPKDRPPRARIDASVLTAPYVRPQRLPARQPLRVVAGGAAIAKGVAGVALDVSTSKLMDRLVRSRGWIGIVAFGLIGIVAMQVSMLKLNAGIGRAVETENTLERANSSLRGDVSRLSAGDHIQSLASARGFVMPAPADVSYLRARNLRSDGARAARRMQAPDPRIAGPAGAPIATPVGVVAPAGSTAAAAPAAPVGTTAPAGTTVPAATTAPAGTTAPPAQVAAPPAQVAAPTAAAPATSGSPTGGVAPPAAAPGVGGTG